MKILLHLLVLSYALLLSGCITLNPYPQRTETTHFAPVSTGDLAKVAESLKIKAPETVTLPLSSAKEGMDWRLALIDHANQSIDLQYFIWSADAVGSLVFDHLLKAADRGVRVRLLVDDLALEGSDLGIAAISKHPNLEIRIYNPGSVRKSALGGIGEYMLYFRELNRRMHNKLFVADNHFAIIGGRNIGNPYFGLSDKYNNRDLDILLAGNIVQDINRAFDDYWNADLAYPGEELSSKATAEMLPEIRRIHAEELESHKARLSSYPLDRMNWKSLFDQLPENIDKGRAYFLQDIPVSVNGQELKLNDMIDQVAGESSKELIIVSPYFIPSGKLLKQIAEMTSRGVTVKIITGSLGSNNHTAVHSHYRKYRRKILAAGAELYEFRHDPSEEIRSITDVPPVRANFISLHAKTLVADRNKVFIGSLNLDPRAVVLNTENGIYIESEALGEDIAKHLGVMMLPENAWRVTVNEEGQMLWTSSEGIASQQPARHFSQRIADFFYRMLPIESQL